MLEIRFNDGWKFRKGKEAFSLIWNTPEDSENVTLPHDAMIAAAAYSNSPNGSGTGYRDGDVYDYVKILYAPKEYRDKTILLKFEGIYMNAFIYVNGVLACKQPYGYSNFYVAINDHLHYGKDNEIRIFVRNGAMANSRWYSGGGIYRDAYILISGLSYMIPEGINIVTENLTNDYASLYVSTELLNRGHTLESHILETAILYDCNIPVAMDRIPVALFAGEERTVLQRMVVESPRIWSSENPNLYTCVSKLYCGESVIDESKTTFGIRTLQIDARNGFQVNGVFVKLRGACIHHDSGLLGAATYEDAQYRQVAILKESGFNAIRMAHNPMAPAMLRACDELGVYVIDEAFDMWCRCKSDYDYALYFQEWWERDVTAMVRKDWNHPSVILYSLGNEIPEIGNVQGAQICHRINQKIKSLDSKRFTLTSINGVFAAGDAMAQIVADITGTEANIDGRVNVNAFMTLMRTKIDDLVMHPIIGKRLETASAFTDIAGYNYMAARYESDGQQYPNRIIVGSETKPPDIAKDWGIVENLAFVIGDFVWTGWDYIGEAGIGIPAYQPGEGGFGAKYPCQLAYCGDIDITGFRRPASYFREIVFGLRKDPFITVQNPHQHGVPVMKTPWIISDSISSWTYDGVDGKPVIVEVYSPGDEVELFCNNVSLGKKAAGKAVGFITIFETVYLPGELTAVSYENSIEIGKMRLSTAGNRYKPVLKAQDYRSKELIYVSIELQDESGNTVTNADCEIQVEVEGSAEILAVGSANPKPLQNYSKKSTKTYNGRALLIIKKTAMHGEIKINACSSGFGNALLRVGTASRFSQ